MKLDAIVRGVTNIEGGCGQETINKEVDTINMQVIINSNQDASFNNNEV